MIHGAAENGAVPDALTVDDILAFLYLTQRKYKTEAQVLKEKFKPAFNSAAFLAINSAG